MNNLPKEKRDKIILIGIGALAVCGALWFLLISAQNAKIETLETSLLDLQGKVSRAKIMTRRAASIESELAELRDQIGRAESEMIPAEQLSSKKWLSDTLFNFIKDKHRVLLTGMSNDPVIGSQFLPLPKFAYSGAAYTVELRAFYHDFGKFLAAFENDFPYVSVQQLQIWPVATPKGAPSAVEDPPEELLNSIEREQLRISMQVVVLFKPPGS